MQTGGFQFSTPQRQSLATVQGPRFDFVSGASLVPDVGNLPDPGIDTWMRGQQQATENLLSGVTVGIKGITEGVSDRAKLNEAAEQLRLKREQEKDDSHKKFLQDVYIANIKENSDSNNLSEELKQLTIDEKKRDAAIAAGNYDFEAPLPEAAPLANAGTAFSLRDGDSFSAGLRGVVAPSEQTKQAAEAPPLAAGSTPAQSKGTGRYIEQDLGGGRVGVLDRATGKLVPGTVAMKEEGAPAAPAEGYSKESYTRKTPTGTETFKKEGAGKELTSDMVTKLSQFDSTLMTMNEIKKTMAGVDRGPITGFIRSKNPYDVDARYLTKLVESVVPGLARTVFGEVGVLTDADVKRYKSMVPNMETEEQVAEALMGMLEQKIKSSFDGYINTAKKAGYDVGGFEAAQKAADAATDKTAAQSGLYNEIKALRDQVAGVSVVDTKRPELIQAIAKKTKEYIEKTGQKPKF
jgi:hypothetical protein